MWRFNTAAASRTLEQVPSGVEFGRLTRTVFGAESVLELRYETVDELLEAEDPDNSDDNIAGQQDKEHEPIRIEETLAEPKCSNTADNW